MKPVLYIVANQSLNMSAGKLAAQVGHAVAGVFASQEQMRIANDPNPGSNWLKSPHRWLIVLEGEDDVHLSAIREYLQERGVGTYMVIDEGVNEVRPFAFTALGVQLLDKDSEQAGYLSGLKKYTRFNRRDSVMDILDNMGLEIPDKYLNRLGRKIKKDSCQSG